LLRRAQGLPSLITGLVALSLVVSCSGNGSPTVRASTRTASTASIPATTSPLAPYYTQQLRWTPCGGGFSCARLRVPLDYPRPAAVGSLVLNTTHRG